MERLILKRHDTKKTSKVTLFKRGFMKIIFFSLSPLEFAGGFEKWFIESAVNLKKRFVDIEEIIIVNPNRAVVHTIIFFVGLVTGRSLRPYYREGEQVVRERLGHIPLIRVGLFSARRVFRSCSLVYTNSEFLELLILKLIGQFSRSPIVVSFHLPLYYDGASRLAERLHNIIYSSRIYYWLLGGIAAFHVVNQYTYDRLRKIFPSKRMEKIFTPFDVDSFVRPVIDIPPAKKDAGVTTILWVARLSDPKKGVDDLCAIIDVLNKSEYKKRIDWRIAGDGPKRAQVDAMARRYDNVLALGHVLQSAMINEYRRSDLVLSTSKWEQLPFATIEPIAAGVPVIAFDVPGHQDIIMDGLNGFLVRNIDESIRKIQEFVDGKIHFDPALLSEDIKKRFNFDKNYNQLFNLFCEALPEQDHH